MQVTSRYVFVRQTRGAFGRHTWRARSSGDLGCELLIDGRSRLGTLMRGEIRCAQRGDILACVHQHATHLDYQQGWFVRLSDGAQMPMAIVQSTTEVPRWGLGDTRSSVTKQGHVELTSTNEKTRTVHRVPAPVW